MISTSELLELKVKALDGEVGNLRDLVFDDSDWTVRELIADAGGRLFGRRVAIDPDDALEPDVLSAVLPVELTREQVKNNPAPEPVILPEGPPSEEVLAWNKSNALAAVPENLLLAGATLPAQPLATEPAPAPILHLHKLKDVTDYEVWAGEERCGTLTGFLVDPVAWDLPLALVSLIDDGPTVLLPTRLIKEVYATERVMRTYLQPSVLRNATIYDPRVLDEHAYLPAVADYYGTRA